MGSSESPPVEAVTGAADAAAPAGDAIAPPVDAGAGAALSASHDGVGGAALPLGGEDDTAAATSSDELDPAAQEGGGNRPHGTLPGRDSGTGERAESAARTL